MALRDLRDFSRYAGSTIGIKYETQTCCRQKSFSDAEGMQRHYQSIANNMSIVTSMHLHLKQSYLLYFYIDAYFRFSALPPSGSRLTAVDPVAALANLTTSIALGSRINL